MLERLREIAQDRFKIIKQEIDSELYIKTECYTIIGFNDDFTIIKIAHIGYSKELKEKLIQSFNEQDFYLLVVQMASETDEEDH